MSTWFAFDRRAGVREADSKPSVARSLTLPGASVGNADPDGQFTRGSSTAARRSYAADSPTATRCLWGT